jgi:hypothetical protein
MTAIFVSPCLFTTYQDGQGRNRTDDTRISVLVVELCEGWPRSTKLWRVCCFCAVRVHDRIMESVCVFDGYSKTPAESARRLRLHPPRVRPYDGGRDQTARHSRQAVRASALHHSVRAHVARRMFLSQSRATKCDKMRQPERAQTVSNSPSASAITR